MVGDGDDGRAIRNVVLMGRFGPAFLAFVRRWKAQGISTYLLEITNRNVRGQHYSSCLDGGEAIHPDMIGTPEGIEAVRAYVNTMKAGAIIAASDAPLLWLAENRHLFEPACKLLVPSYSCLSLLSSKENQIRMAREAGFDLLPTWYLSNTEGCRDIPERNFPICVRPSDPTAVAPTFKAKVMYSVGALYNFLRTLQRWQQPVIAQPFLCLPDLKVHGARSENGEILAMRPFFVRRKFEGVTLTLQRIEFPPGVEECCRKFADASGITGCFHYDLLFSHRENHVYYLEINARMGGITDKALRFGYDQPSLFLRAYGLRGPKSAAPFPITRRSRVVNKRAVLKHIVMGIKGGLVELDYPPVGHPRHIGISLFELFFAKDSVFHWRDLRGSLWFYSQWLHEKSFERGY